MREIRPLRAYAEVALGRQRSPQYEVGSYMTPYLRAANVKDGVLDLSDVKEMNFEPPQRQTFSLDQGDVLVTEGSGSLRSVGASAVWLGEIEGPVCFQNTVLRLRPRPGTDPRFLAWWCRHAFADGIFASVALGANIFHISAERVRALPVSYVPLSAQRAMADYLDLETARIDTLIEKKQRMMDVLSERRAASVRATATHHQPWPPLRRTWQIIDCKHRTPEYQNAGFPVVSPGDVEPGRLNLGRCHRFVGEADLQDLTEGGRRPRRGDVIYSRNASIGIAAYVDTDEPFTMGQDVCLIRSPSADQLWLTYMLNSIGMDQLEQMKVGSTFDRVNISQLLDLRIPTPAPSVQHQEAAKLDTGARHVENLLSRLVAQISLLHERRQALITAAVTGELGVPEVAA